MRPQPLLIDGRKTGIAPHRNGIAQQRSPEREEMRRGTRAEESACRAKHRVCRWGEPVSAESCHSGDPRDSMISRRARVECLHSPDLCLCAQRARQAGQQECVAGLAS